MSAETEPHRRAAGTRPEVTLVAGGFEFPEAPTWHEGLLWVSDITAGGVSALTSAGSRAEHRLDGRRGIGGLAACADGRLLASGRDLVDSESGDPVLGRPEGSRGLNDLGVSSSGDLLIGVLNYRPLAGDVPARGSVGQVSRGHVDWTWAEGVTWPNGIAESSDGAVAIADFADGRIVVVDDAEGRGGRTLARSHSGHFDGLCADVSNHLWAATGPGGAIVRLDRSGNVVDRVDLPASFASSVCFSGSDSHVLYATVAGCSLTNDRSGAVLSIEVDTAGRAVPLVRW